LLKYPVLISFEFGWRGSAALSTQHARHPASYLCAAQVLANSRAMANKLTSLGYKLVSGGTDNHLVMPRAPPHPTPNSRPQYTRTYTARFLPCIGVVAFVSSPPPPRNTAQRAHAAHTVCSQDTRPGHVRRSSGEMVCSSRVLLAQQQHTSLLNRAHFLSSSLAAVHCANSSCEPR
jgi:hypothetical protein